MKDNNSTIPPNLSSEYDIDFSHHPHDKYLRHVLQFNVITKQLLQYFLPKEMSDALDFDTLTQSEDSYLDERLSEHFTDICYSCMLKKKTSKGKKETVLDVRIALIFEHKSSNPGYAAMLEQLLRYISNAWSNDQRQNRPLSLTIPVVIYHGKQRMKKTGPKQVFGHVPVSFLGYVPSFDYFLINIHDVVDDVPSTMDFILLRKIFLALKSSRNAMLMEQHYEEIINFAPDYPTRSVAISIIKVTYLYLAQTSPLFIQKLSSKMTSAQNIATKRKPKGEIVIQMLKEIEANSWELGIAEGRVEGRVEGRAEGRAEGMDLTLSVIKYLNTHPESSDAEVMQLFNIQDEKLRKIRQTMEQLR